MTIPADALHRFAASLDTLVPADARIGVAVSGGPDSLALLLLIAAARPGRVAAATVDHGLRDAAASEASMVAEVCAALGVPHIILKADWPSKPSSNIQAAARDMRYRLLTQWAATNDMTSVATAHHADDQAETLLMRLSRGAGLSGLAGVRMRRPLAEGVTLVRPLLGWRKAALIEIVDEAGIVAVADPSNGDDSYDRTRVRRLLAEVDWLAPERLAGSASALADSEEAMNWAVDRIAAAHLSKVSGVMALNPSGLPREIARRLVLRAFDQLGAPTPRGPDLDRALTMLSQGRPASLSGLLLRPGHPWTIAPEPPRSQ